MYHNSASAVNDRTRPATGSGGYRPAFEAYPSDAKPFTFGLARLVLVVTLLAAPFSFGAVVPWAKITLGLVASLALFLWGLASVQQGVIKFTWSPLYLPLALFFLLGVLQYGAGLALDSSETRQAWFCWRRV